ncbi:hypothetical protein E8E12_009618 [Didymella heteroderae]|uniref:Uncharacterized protein n=1 Tax=Didymella heteroderae TaxID=1769908 RepID=A0A9P5C2M3_9PLEO|nr:hypothetical protein E8E12_009618 [Didymella heteroderae]
MAAAHVNNDFSAAAEVGYGHFNTSVVPECGASFYGTDPGTQSHLEISPRYPLVSEVAASIPRAQFGTILSCHPTFNIQLFNDHSGTFQPVSGSDDKPMDLSSGTGAPPDSTWSFAHDASNDPRVVSLGQAFTNSGYIQNPPYPVLLDFEDIDVEEPVPSLKKPQQMGSRGRSPSLSGISLAMERTYPEHMYIPDGSLAQDSETAQLETPRSTCASDHAATSPFTDALTPATSQTSYLQLDGGVKTVHQPSMANMPYVPQAQLEQFADMSGWGLGSSLDTAKDPANEHAPLHNAFSRSSSRRLSVSHESASPTPSE